MNTDTIANSNADDPTKALCSLSQNWWLFAARCLGIDFCSPRVLDATIGSVGHDHHVRRIFLGQWRFQLVCSGAPYPEKERWGWLLFSGIVGILTASSSWLLLGSPR
jgi:hypothetical protein